MENDGGNKEKNSGFYTFRGGCAGGRVERAAPEGDKPLKVCAEPAAKTPETPRDDAEGDEAGKRDRATAWALIILLALGVLAAAIFDPGVLGLAGAQAAATASPSASPSVKQLRTGNTDAALFLYSQPWDNKKHDSMQSLKKLKNLRCALEFFQAYPPKDAAAVPFQPCDLSDVAANYSRLAGTFVSFHAEVLGKDAVTEDMGLPGGPPVLLTLPGDEARGGASLLVLGPLEGVNKGDTVKCRCIPIYCYSPKDNPASGGLLLVTTPQLVYKAK